MLCLLRSFVLIVCTMSDDARHTAGWYPDYADPNRMRYWNGQAWAADTAPPLPPIAPSNASPNATPLDWPEPTNWMNSRPPLTKRGRLKNSERQGWAIEAERNRHPEPSPAAPSTEAQGHRRQLGHRSCSACGNPDFKVFVPYYRRDYSTYRCKYCLSWSQIPARSDKTGSLLDIAMSRWS